MRSLRKRLKQAVLATLPAAALVTCGCSSAGKLPSSCNLPAPTSTGDGGCGSCDPLNDLCAAAEYVVCTPACNDCGCTNVEVVDPAPGLAGPGTSLGGGADGGWCAARCDSPPAPGATLVDCHLEYDADSQALPAGDGGAKMACTWEVAGASCASGVQPCARCNPTTDLCFPNVGTCLTTTRFFCSGSTTENPANATTVAGDGGVIDPSACASLCDHPADVTISDAPLSCHLELGPDGSPRRCNDEAVVSCQWPSQSMCTGRRPEGFAAADTGGGLGAHFASMAQLEAASIPAFRRLERELTSLTAPHALRERARAAARDEVRHAREMSRLARKHGARVPKVQLEKFSPRARVDIAVENAVEGCVRETFGAALALWQAERASDPEVREAMRAIADDEAAHAELAWDVAAWLESRCTASENERVHAARAAAVRALEASLATEADAFSAHVGLPSRNDAARLLHAVAKETWS